MKILPIYKLSYQRVIPSGSGTDEKINSILLKVVAPTGALYVAPLGQEGPLPIYMP